MTRYNEEITKLRARIASLEIDLRSRDKIIESQRAIIAELTRNTTAHNASVKRAS